MVPTKYTHYIGLTRRSWKVCDQDICIGFMSEVCARAQSPMEQVLCFFSTQSFFW